MNTKNWLKYEFSRQLDRFSEQRIAELMDVEKRKLIVTFDSPNVEFKWEPPIESTVWNPDTGFFKK